MNQFWYYVKTGAGAGSVVVAGASITLSAAAATITPTAPAPAFGVAAESGVITPASTGSSITLSSGNGDLDLVD